MLPIGTYHCATLKSTFTITSCNDANGQGTGSMTLGPTTMSFNFHYHYVNNSGPACNLCLSCSQDNPNAYLGAAGYTPDNGASGIQLSGGLGANWGLESFHGTYTLASN